MGLSVTLYIPIDAGQDIKPDEPYWENEYHEFYSRNITHNLTEMADKADLYNALWRPHRTMNLSDEDEYSKDIHASDISEHLKAGINKLISDPALYKSYNPSNGWGSYEGLVDFAQTYYDACIKYPKAIVDVSR